jgi:hypothetical protein
MVDRIGEMMESAAVRDDNHLLPSHQAVLTN